MWALGITLIDVYSGQLPYSNSFQGAPIKLLVQLSQGIIQPAIPDCLPMALRDLVEQCLIVDVKARATAKVLLDHAALAAVV